MAGFPGHEVVQQDATKCISICQGVFSVEEGTYAGRSEARLSVANGSIGREVPLRRRRVVGVVQEAQKASPLAGSSGRTGKVWCARSTAIWARVALRLALRY